MICLLCIKRNTPLEVREQFNIKNKKREEYFNVLKKEFKEIIILSTCNRTEIYFNVSYNDDEEILKKIFELFEWNNNLKEYVVFSKEEEAYRHIFEVCCGFHSKITGEDQILGQVKNALYESRKYKASNVELDRLFQMAAACGKEFRNSARLYEIPVSSVSITVNDALNRNLKKYMILGYGEIGRLTVKYLLGHNAVERIYLVVRNSEIKNEITDSRVSVISFDEKNAVINDMECIIGCTSASHTVVKENEISKEGSMIYMYDLAVPRDFDKGLKNNKRTQVYNIDEISVINDKNHKLRIEKMNENKYILKKYICEYKKWLKLRSITEEIKDIKGVGNIITQKRTNTFKNKQNTKNHEKMAEMLIKSTSDFYINNAIDVLKEETLKGREEECLKIIKKIFKI